MDTIVSINVTNLPTTIDSLNRSFDDCYETFENITDSVSLLKRNFRNDKSKINTELEDYNESLLDNLDQLHKLISGDKCQTDNFDLKITEFDSVLNKYQINYDNAIESFRSLKDKVVKTMELHQNKVSIDNNANLSNKPNPLILNSRQTKHPFIISVMKPGMKSNCDGCKNKILHQTNYLQHLEEYPSGSKIFRPHGYHINRDCVFRRGFELSYIKEARITSDEVLINKSIFESLREVGFETENIDMTMENLKLNESPEPDDKYLSDNQSENSPARVASPERSNLSFKYFRKLPHMKNLICEGCRLNINEGAYLMYGNRNIDRPSQYHIRKSCLQKGGFTANMSSERCYVGTILKTHDEIKQLLSCGFYYKNIIGFRPKNPNNFKSHIREIISNTNDHKHACSHLQIVLPETPVKNQSPRDVDFIFNDQPFSYKKSAYAEKCKGCDLQILKNCMALCHKEKETRNNLENLSLISQWYHVSTECLRARGFSNRYLSSSKCYCEDINDQYPHVENLIKCGFRLENIELSLPEFQETFGFQSESKTLDIYNEKKLFVNNSDNSLSRCKGCFLPLTPGQPCFIYSSTPIQNDNAKLFHIRRSCLENCFNREEIRSMSCITINMEDVSPNEIINCGVFNIIPFINKTPSNRNRYARGRNRSQKSNQRYNSSNVDNTVEDDGPCSIA